MRRLCKFCFLFMIQLLLNTEAFDHGTYNFTIFGTKVSCMCFEHFFKVFEDHRSWRYKVMSIYRNIRSWFVICYLVGDSVTKGHYFPVSSSFCSFLYSPGAYWRAHQSKPSIDTWRMKIQAPWWARNGDIDTDPEKKDSVFLPRHAQPLVQHRTIKPLQYREEKCCERICIWHKTEKITGGSPGVLNPELES